MTERARAVDGGVIHHLSASAINKWHRCRRQWRFKYVERLPDKPPSRGLQRGLAGHKRLAHYLTTGEDVLNPLERRAAREGAIPAPGPDLMVEIDVEPFLALDVPMAGAADLVLFRGAVVVVDWKFKKSIELYAADDEDLASTEDEEGRQMLAYAAKFGPLLGAREVTLRHVTFQTEGTPDYDVAEIAIPVDSAVERWETVSRRAVPLIKQDAAAGSAFDVPKDGESKGECEKYGGCPYKSTCLDRMARLAAGFAKHAASSPPNEGKTVGMLSQITKPGATPPPNGAAPSAAVVQASRPPSKMQAEAVPLAEGLIPASRAVQGQSYDLGAKGAGKFLTLTKFGATSYASFLPDAGGAPLLVPPDYGVKPLAAVPPSTGGYVFSPDEVRKAVAAPPIVVPPDAPKSDPALAAKPAPGTITSPSGVTITAEEHAQAKKVEAVIFEAEAPKPKRPRAPKTIEESAAEGTSPLKVEKMAGVHLYFGCSPVGVVAQSLGPYVEEIDAQIRKAAQVTACDLRVASDNTLGFGKWAGFVASQAKEFPPPPGHYIVMRGDGREEAAAAALAHVALPGNVTIGKG